MLEYTHELGGQPPDRCTRKSHATAELRNAIAVRNRIASTTWGGDSAVTPGRISPSTSTPYVVWAGGRGAHHPPPTTHTIPGRQCMFWMVSLGAGVVMRAAASNYAMLLHPGTTTPAQHGTAALPGLRAGPHRAPPHAGTMYGWSEGAHHSSPHMTNLTDGECL
jgi:hypothetical protein